MMEFNQANVTELHFLCRNWYYREGQKLSHHQATKSNMIPFLGQISATQKNGTHHGNRLINSTTRLHRPREERWADWFSAMIEADGYWRVANHAWQMIACSHLFSLISDGFNCRTCWRRHAFVSLIGGGSVVRIVWKKVGRVRIWLTWVSSHVLVFSDRDVALMGGLVLCSPNAFDLLWHHFSLTGRGGHDLDGWFVHVNKPQAA